MLLQHLLIQSPLHLHLELILLSLISHPLLEEWAEVTCLGLRSWAVAMVDQEQDLIQLNKSTQELLVKVQLEEIMDRIVVRDMLAEAETERLRTTLLAVGAAAAGMLSVDGRCKTLDARANGYARSEAVGALVLRPSDTGAGGLELPPLALLLLLKPLQE